tara:strand:+ start:12927 stop:13295 length:369 start_codon:yes stop_codon:yes gene_type:complete
MLLPTQCVDSLYKYLNQGSVVVSALPAPPPKGGGTFDGTTWTLSNYDVSGLPVNWERDVAAGDDLFALTSTGNDLGEVVSIVTGSETTVITMLFDTEIGAFEVGQITGIWKVVTAGVLCTTT